AGAHQPEPEAAGAFQDVPLRELHAHPGHGGAGAGMISGFCRSAVLPLPLLALVAAARAQNPPTQPPPPEVLRIRVEADHVTAEIRSSPLRHVLEELAARTGIVFEVATAWNPLISLTLYKVPLQEAVQRVVGGGDSIFY